MHTQTTAYARDDRASRSALHDPNPPKVSLDVRAPSLKSGTSLRQVPLMPSAGNAMAMKRGVIYDRSRSWPRKRVVMRLHATWLRMRLLANTDTESKNDCMATTGARRAALVDLTHRPREVRNTRRKPTGLGICFCFVPCFARVEGCRACGVSGVHRAWM